MGSDDAPGIVAFGVDILVMVVSAPTHADFTSLE